MRRLPAPLFVALSLAACAEAPDHKPQAGPDAGFATARDSYLDHREPTPAAPAAAAGSGAPVDGALSLAVDPAEPATMAVDLDAGDLERSLRERLATSAAPAEAALALAALLCDQERHAEALAALHAAKARSADAALRIAAAGVQRDLGQRHLAAAELRSLVREQGALALHPGLLFELAELQWMEGDGSAAAATLVELRQAHGEQPWCQRNAAALRALDTELATATRPRRVRVRDLLGNLRGAPVEIVRLRTLEELVTLAGATRDPAARADGQAPPDLFERAIAIGCGDESPMVRARAVQLAEPLPDDRERFCQAGLHDSAAVVREHTAARTAALLGEAGKDLLLASLQRESDADAFFAMHAALASLVPSPPQLARSDCGDADRRAAVVRAFRDLVHRDREP